MSPSSGRTSRDRDADATTSWERAGRGRTARRRGAGGSDASDSRGTGQEGAGRPSKARTTAARRTASRTDDDHHSPDGTSPERAGRAVREGSGRDRASRGRADRDGTDRGRAGREGADRDRTGRDRAGRDRDRTGRDRTGRDRTGRDRTDRRRVGAERARAARAARAETAETAGTAEAAEAGDVGRDTASTPSGGLEAAAARTDPQPSRRRWWSVRRRAADATTGPRRPVPLHYRRRRLAAALVAVAMLLVGVGAGTWVLLYHAGVANVQEITVAGLSTVPEQAVRDAAAVPLGGPLISVDTAGAAQRVAAVEGVAAVEVRRAWPHTVEINVTERVPVALWQSAQGLFEVDGTGLPYRLAPNPPPTVPRLAFAGVAPQDPSTAAVLAVLHDLTDPLRARVATAEVAGTSVTLGLTDGRSVRWGDPDRSTDKVAVLSALLGQPGKVYDVSSPDLPTVRP